MYFEYEIFCSFIIIEINGVPNTVHVKVDSVSRSTFFSFDFETLYKRDLTIDSFLVMTLCLSPEDGGLNSS